MKYKTIEIEFQKDGKVALLKLNRPDALNSLNFQLAKDFVSGIKEISENARAVVITGNGKAFSAGGDLGEFKTSGDPKQFLLDLAGEFHKGVKILRKMDAPVVAAVNGSCFGVGLSLACCCDFRIASIKAKFCYAFTGVGLSGDSSLPFFLPRIVGLGKATEMALRNLVINSDEALKINLISGLTAPDLLMGEALSIADKLAKMPTVAAGRIKRLFDDSYSDNLDEHLEKELQFIGETAATEDFQEGCAAFFERRKPDFKGK